MREIKFRAWTGDGYEYNVLYGVFGVFYVNPGEKKDGLDVKDKASISPFNTKLDPVTLEQFTGLKDKNGRDIYEGDIVEAWFDGGPVGGEYKERVTIKMDEWGVNLQRWFIEEPEFTPVIVGNIHEVS